MFDMLDQPEGAYWSLCIYMKMFLKIWNWKYNLEIAYLKAWFEHFTVWRQVFKYVNPKTVLRKSQMYGLG